jgi:hypothetical protein
VFSRINPPLLALSLPPPHPRPQDVFTPMYLVVMQKPLSAK